MADYLDQHQTFTPTIHEAEPGWMHEYFRLIADSFARIRNQFVFEPTYVEPGRKFDGLTVFADGARWDPGAGRGVYYWNSQLGAAGEWVMSSAAGATTATVMTVPLPTREGEEVNDLNTQQDVNWYLWDAIEEVQADTDLIDTKVNKSGDTITGQLNIQGANLHMKGSGGVTNLQLSANGDIDAKAINATGQINAHDGIQMYQGTVHGLADPVEDHQAATKTYVDEAILAGGVLGRPFKFRSSGVDHYRLNAGEFQMTTTNNAAWTNVLANAAFLSFSYKDEGGVYWKMGHEGSYSMPTGFIQVYGSGGMLGWWLYEAGDNPAQFTDYGSLGGVIIVVKSWVPTSNTTNLPSNSTFRLHSPWWGK